MAETICPRCGFRDSFMKGFLPGTCVCKVCQSQLVWHEIPGMGPDCVPLDDVSADDEAPGLPEEPPEDDDA
jgi:hypothetical protein